MLALHGLHELWIWWPQSTFKTTEEGAQATERESERVDGKLI